MLSANKKRIKYEIKMFLALTIASAVIAFNLKSFVQTGGLSRWRRDTSDLR